MRLVLADAVWMRLVGLSVRRNPPEGWGLLIPRCRSVHTVGMRFSIDVVFLDHWGWPIEIRRSVPPWRVVSCRKAAAVVELKAGDADRYFVVPD